jgi:hypothetical protein
MTGYLGYHPDRVLALRRALAAALAEAPRVRCDDPLAAGAMERWWRATRVMQAWEARLVALLGCGFASPYRRVAPDVALPLDYMRPLDRAWTVVADPLAAALPPVDALARADELLALLLDDRALDRLLADPALLARLHELLGVVWADDHALARFFGRLGPERFAVLAIELRIRQLAGEEVDAAAALLRALATGLGRAVRTGEIDEATYRAELLDAPGGDPVVAALIVRDAQLPSSVAAGWASAILARIGPVLGPTGGLFADPAGEAVEALLLALTADPVAARAVLAAVDRLDQLLSPLIDGELRGRFLLAAVDPVRFDVASSLPLVERVLDELVEHQELAGAHMGETTLHDWLGAFVGPHLLELVPPGCTTCTTSGGRPTLEIIRWIAESERAALSLTIWLHQAARRLAADVPISTVAGADALAPRIEQLGVLMEAVLQGQLAHARADHDDYAGDLGAARFVLGKVAAGAAVVTMGPFGTGAGPLVDAGTGLLVEWTADRWVDEPAHPDDVAASLDRRGGAWEAAAIASATGALHRRVTADARSDEAVPDPPAPGAVDDATSYLDRVDQWADRDDEREAYSVLADDVGRSLRRGRIAARRALGVDDPLAELGVSA